MYLGSPPHTHWLPLTHTPSLTYTGSLTHTHTGFSRQVVELLDEIGADYSTFNILADEEVRQGQSVVTLTLTVNATTIVCVCVCVQV